MPATAAATVARGIAIENADSLHEAIALAIVSTPQALRGQEVRFLRSMLKISQAGLGDTLGYSRATVARWEGVPDEAIPGSADRALRFYFALKMIGQDVATQLVELVTEIGELDHKHVIFGETEQGWKQKAA